MDKSEQEEVNNEDISTNISSDYLFSLTKVLEHAKLKELGYIFKGKIAYLPEVYSKFISGKLDDKASNMDLIENMLDNLDGENLVKETFYNVSGTKYVSTVVVNKLLS